VTFPRITVKNAISAVATVCVTVISIIAVAASPEHIKAWHGLIVLLGVAAIAASIVQMFLQSSDDDKLKEMMTTLLRAVVKSETQTDFRPQERAITELDSTTDPMVYVEIEDKRRGSVNPSTPFELINRGKAPAHRVQIQPLKLHSGEVTFAPIEVLPNDNKPVAVIPKLEGIFPILRHDLTRFLQRDWNDSVGPGRLPTESQYEYILPMSVTYETYDSKSKFETSFDVVYRVVQDIIQKDWHVSVEGEPPLLEVRNLKFKRLA
jgi:hypothetical protein